MIMIDNQTDKMFDGSAMPGYSIREARLEDIEEIYEIELVSIKNPWTVDNYISEFEVDFSYFIVAEDVNKKITGFAVSWLVKDELHIHKIAVDPGHRRLGIASGLIGYYIKKFGDTGLKTIYLEVREKNKGARAFYKKLGFEENGVRHDYYPDDNAILIQKMV